MAQAAGKSKKIKNDNLLVKLINGRLLSSDFFARHWKSVLLAILMVLIYITNRYQCLTRMEEIRRLEQELEVVETERIRVRSTYMSRIRESSMQEMVDTMHLNLRIQDKPPYKLRMKKENRSHILLRYALVIGCILIFASFIVYKAFDTTVISASRWNEKAMKELSRVDTIRPERGNILASSGSLLAPS